MKQRKERKNSNSFRNLYVPVTPFYNMSEGKRYIPFCGCGYHLGAIHPSAFSGGKTCLTGCWNSYFFELPDSKFFSEEHLIKEIERQSSEKRKTPAIPLSYIKHPHSGKKAVWVLDRGHRIFILKNEKLNLVNRLEEDHFLMELDISKAKRF